MRKMCKRGLSLLLALLMLFGGMTAALAAEEPEMEIRNDSVYVDSVDGVGNALSKAMLSGDTEDTGYGISAVTMDGKTAHVTMQAADACTLVVALYAEDKGQMLGSGMCSITAEDDQVDVTIEIGSVPEYYILKAFLLDENRAALCKEFVSIEQTKVFEEFDDKTVDDFSEQIVLNFDEDKDDNFAVLKDGAVQLETNDAHNVLQSHDEESGTYVFTNIDESLRGLKSGDVFTFRTDTDIYLLKVDTITISGDTATIVEQTDTSYADYFQYIDVDQTSSETGEDMTFDVSQADEGVELIGYEPWDTSEVSAQTEIIDHDDHLKISCPILEYPSSSSDSTFAFEVKFRVKITADVNVKIYYDAEWEWRWDIWNGYKDYAFFQIKLDIKVTGEVTIGAKLQHDWLLGTGNFVTPIGVVITFEAHLHIEVSAGVTFSIDFLTITLGVRYDENVGFQNLCEKPKFSLVPKVEGKAEVRVGIRLGPAVSFLKAIELKLEGEGGVKAVVTLFSVDFKEVLAISDVKKIHLCDQPCFDGEFQAYFTLKIKGKFLGQTFKEKQIGAEYTHKIADFYIRLNPFSFHLSTKCPNTAYRVDYTVVNKYGKPIDNLDVKSGAPDLGEKYRFNVQNATDKNGKVSFFYPTAGGFIQQAKTYTVEFLLDGVSYERTLTMIGENVSMTVKLNTDKTDGGGSGHQSYSGVAPGYSDGVGSDDTPFSEIAEQGQLIRFGSYPQSEVTNVATRRALHNLLAAAEKDDPNVWTSYGYYSGPESLANGKMKASDYMWYVDLYYNGEKYRGVKFSQFRPYCTGFEADSGNSCQDDNGYDSLEYVYWFLYEPIWWSVLDPATGLVLCANILDAQAYNNFVYDSGSEHYGDAACSFRANDWAKTSLYAWLTHDFYATAFSAAQQDRLREVNRVNQCSDPNQPQYDSTRTWDKVFLLSKAEVCNTRYGFSGSDSSYDSARTKRTTDYAQCQGAYTESGGSYDGNGWWWLSSPYPRSDTACEVTYRGSADIAGFVGVASAGVCPALVLNLASGISKSPKKAAVRRTEETGAVVNVRQGKSYSAAAGGAVEGNDYVLLVRRSGTGALTPENLLYIDQLTAADDAVAFTYSPRADGDAVVEIIGDFGSGVETRTPQGEAVDYLAVWQIDDETVTQFYKPGETITPPADPVKEGFTFTGWSPAVPATMPAEDLTFTAVFTEKTYTVRWVVDGVQTTQTYKAGETITPPADPVKEGFTFTGWSPAVPATMPAEDLTFTAQFTAQPCVRSVAADDVRVTYKKTAALRPSVTADSGAKVKVTYTGYDPKIISVDADGTVTALKKGSTTVTVTATDTYGNAVECKTEVTVRYAWWQWIIILFLFGWLWY